MPEIPCGVCGGIFYAKPSHQSLGWGKYCSVKCRSKAQLKGKTVECLTCHKQVYKSPAQIKHSRSGSFFCSKSCQAISRNSSYTSQDHPNWTTGITVYRDILLRSGVNQVCSCCNIDDIRVLVVHHLDHNRHNNLVSNLIWVCLNCHHLIHHDKEYERKLLIQYNK